MKKTFTAAAVLAATCLFASPALANEGRVEARGGLFWAGDETEATAGVAAGYDFDLGDKAFVGAEVSADKVLVEDADVYFGFTGRIGGKVGNGRLFAAGGYTVSDDDDAFHLGGGYEHRIGSNLYLKAEYRHFFGDAADADTVVAGLGVKF